MDSKNKSADDAARMELFEQFYNLSSVASASELTGLTPSMPMCEDSAESYAQLYGIPVPDRIDETISKNKKS